MPFICSYRMFGRFSEPFFPENPILGWILRLKVGYCAFAGPILDHWEDNNGSTYVKYRPEPFTCAIYQSHNNTRTVLCLPIKVHELQFSLTGLLPEISSLSKPEIGFTWAPFLVYKSQMILILFTEKSKSKGSFPSGFSSSPW